MSSGWTLYIDGEEKLHSDSAVRTFNGFTLSGNTSRCHTINYKIVWEDADTNIAEKEFQVHSCSQSQSREFHIISNAVSCDSGNGFSGDCTGETVSFSAESSSSGSLPRIVETTGIWEIHRKINTVPPTYELFYGPAATLIDYKFPKNTKDSDAVYKIIYSSECSGDVISPSATTYTVVSGDTCIEPLEYVGVDMGLESGTIWGEHNLGAKHKDAVGLYYAWGCTTGATSDDVSHQQIFTLNNYCLYDSATSKYTSYNDEDKAISLAEGSDAASEFQEGYSIPTVLHIKELLDNATVSTTAGGYNVTKNGKTIFFPTCPYYKSSAISGNPPYIWARTLSPSSNIAIAEIGVIDLSLIHTSTMDRYAGLQIRPIKEEYVKILFYIQNRSSNTSLSNMPIQAVTLTLSKGQESVKVQFFLDNMEWDYSKEINVGKIYTSWTIGSTAEILVFDSEAATVYTGTCETTIFNPTEPLVIKYGSSQSNNREINAQEESNLEPGVEKEIDESRQKGID